MNLSKDVIHRTKIPGNGDEAGLFKYHAERITAAVLTQTYQYMIHTGCEYSCVSTGEAIVFLWVPADSPSELHFHLAEPGLEVGEGMDLQHNRTTIAQTLSFSSWHCNQRLVIGTGGTRRRWPPAKNGRLTSSKYSPRYPSPFESLIPNPQLGNPPSSQTL